MKRSRFTEEQIIGILKEQEVGAKTTNVCRKHGISDATFYKYMAKYGGMDVSEPAIEGAAKLKKLLAQTMLDNAILKDVAPKNGDARCEVECVGSCLCAAWGEPASGVRGVVI